MLILVPHAASKIASPRTNSTLPMIEPVIEALTSGYMCGPCHMATRAMINSAALPNVALSNPPTPGPKVAARLSVARPIKPAKGMMAMPEATNTHRSLAPR